MKTIPASAWNAMVDRIRRDRLIGCTVMRRGGFKHPWQVTPTWDEGRGQWVAEILPGFVNGLDVEASIPGNAAPAESAERLGINPKKAGDAPIDAWLTESPQIPLTGWRKIGKDAAPTSVSGSSLDSIETKYEEVPEFFQALGAGGPPEDLLFPGGGASKPTRLLRATEIVLYKDRIATATDWTEGSGVDGSFAQFNVVYSLPPGARERAYIRTAASYEPPRRPTVADRLLGDWQDVSYDPLHLATVYVLSPEGTASGSAPDADWSPHVKHHVFWNLAHAVDIEPPRDSHDNLTFFTGLAGGVADSFINQTLAIINDHNAAMSEFLGNRTVEGRYWTI